MMYLYDVNWAYVMILEASQRLFNLQMGNSNQKSSDTLPKMNQTKTEGTCSINWPVRDD